MLVTPTFQIYLTYMNLLLQGLIPFLLLVILNTKIYLQIKQLNTVTGSNIRVDRESKVREVRHTQVCSGCSSGLYHM